MTQGYGMARTLRRLVFSTFVLVTIAGGGCTTESEPGKDAGLPAHVDKACPATDHDPVGRACDVPAHVQCSAGHIDCVGADPPTWIDLKVSCRSGKWERLPHDSCPATDDGSGGGGPDTSCPPRDTNFIGRACAVPIEVECNAGHYDCLLPGEFPRALSVFASCQGGMWELLPVEGCEPGSGGSPAGGAAGEGGSSGEASGGQAGAAGEGGAGGESSGGQAGAAGAGGESSGGQSGAASGAGGAE
jgi:hypothetical protein